LRRFGLRLWLLVAASALFPRRPFYGRLRERRIARSSGGIRTGPTEEGLRDTRMGVKAKLKIEAGFGRGKEYIIEEGKPFYVGRDRKCDHYIPSGRASRVHCKIEGTNGSFGVFDLNSRNGTFVNDQRISSRVLRPRDFINVAGIRIRFDLAKPESEGVSGSPVSAPAADAGAEKSDGILVSPRPKATAKPAARQGAETELGKCNFSDEERALVGTQLGELKLVSLIGCGNRCVVYKASDSVKNRIVAVKTLRSSLAQDKKVRHWLVKGAKRSAELRHENAVRVIRGGREDDTLYVVLEYMESSAYDRYRDASEGGLVSVKSALQSVVTVSRALEFGYKEHRILHGGVRPSKILYDERRQAKLLGLGFSHGPQSSGVLAGERLFAFIAPEVVRAASKPSVSTDIYSLGCSFYFMLTGRIPIRDSRGAIPSPCKANAAVPESLERIFEMMVAPAPENRYGGYSNLLHDLRWALRGEVWHSA